MKHNVNKSYLLGLSLLSALLIIGFINVTIGVQINRGSMGVEHRARLHSLYLWNGTATELTGAGMRVFSGNGQKTINVLNGFMVGGGSASGSLVIIGGGTGNNVNGKNIGIGGGSSNRVTSDNSVIGGGSSNIVNGSGGTIVGGSNNTVGANSVVAGGYHNTAQNGGVVLGGQSNTSNGNGGLAFGKNSTSDAGSFSWNGNGSSQSAYISGANGVWIGKSSSINSVLSGVTLYVDGPVKIDNSNFGTSPEGEIRLENGCIRGYDGRSFRTFGRASGDESSPCGGNDGICEFGGVLVQSGDAVTGYIVPFALDCNAGSVKKTGIVCRGGSFQPAMGDYVYPYCYNITASTRYQGEL